MVVTRRRTRNPALAGLRRTSARLRSANRRSIVAAYRHGQMIDTLRDNGWSWEDLGDEIDRSVSTMKLYATLYKRYGSEQEVLEASEILDTTNIAKLTGKFALTPAVYVLSCLRCGSNEIKKTKQGDEDKHEHVVAPVTFQAPQALAES